MHRRKRAGYQRVKRSIRINRALVSKTQDLETTLMDMLPGRGFYFKLTRQSIKISRKGIWSFSSMDPVLLQEEKVGGKVG